jgi:hypothetical protein
MVTVHCGDNCPNTPILREGATSRAMTTTRAGSTRMRLLPNTAATASRVSASATTRATTPRTCSTPTTVVRMGHGRISQVRSHGRTRTHTVAFDLGFDATQDFHRYAVDWRPGRVACRPCR